MSLKSSATLPCTLMGLSVLAFSFLGDITVDMLRINIVTFVATLWGLEFFSSIVEFLTEKPKG